jgi:hypothetical protein
MALVVTCAACGKRLNIPAQLFETKIRGRIVTIGCKQCGTDIKVDGTNVAADEVPDSLDSWAPPPMVAEVAPAAPQAAPQLPLPPPVRREPSSPKAAPVAPGPPPPDKPAATFDKPKSAPLWERPAPGPGPRAALPKASPARPAGQAVAASPVATRAAAPKLATQGARHGPTGDKAPGVPQGAIGARLGDGPVKAQKPAEGITEMLWAVSFADDDDRELTLPEILKALRTGQISTETIVWREGMEGWKSISQVAEFAPYVDSLSLDEPTRLKRPEDVDALKAGLGAAPRLPPLPAQGGWPPQVPATRAPAVETIESIPPELLSAVSEPPQIIDPNSPELIESIPPQPALPRFDAAVLAPMTPPQDSADAPRTPPAKARQPGISPEFSLPPSMPPGLKRKLPLNVFRGVVLGVVGAAVLTLVIVLARRPQDAVVTIPTGPVLSVPAPVAAGAKADAGESPSEASSAPLPSYGDAQGLDLAAAIERSLGKGADKPGAPFNRKVAQALMATAASRAAACRVPSDQKGPAEVAATFEPTGKVSNVEVKPPYAGTPTGKCLGLTFLALRMRPFTGAPATLTQRVMVR